MSGRIEAYAGVDFETARRDLDVKDYERAARGDQAAVERVVRANFPLVLKMVKMRLRRGRYQQIGSELEEYINHAWHGLYKAAENFDVNRGVQFSTYACRCILNEIGKYRKTAARQARVRTERLSNYSNARHSTASVAFDEPHDWEARVRQLVNMTVLTPVEREIINMRFYDNMTLQAISDQIGFTKEAARQTVLRACRKMKEAAMRFDRAVELRKLAAP